jgi:hypothetical protein
MYLGEGIPNNYQEITYFLDFDVKYDLRHKAILVAGGNWTVNEREDIYSGVMGWKCILWEKQDTPQGLDSTSPSIN